MKLKYLLKLIRAGSISIVVPNKFEGKLLQHRIGDTAVTIIPIDTWTPGDLTRHVVIEFPNDMPAGQLTEIESVAVNVIYTGEIL